MTRIQATMRDFFIFIGAALAAYGLVIGGMVLLVLLGGCATEGERQFQADILRGQLLLQQKAQEQQSVPLVDLEMPTVVAVPGGQFELAQFKLKIANPYRPQPAQIVLPKTDSENIKESIQTTIRAVATLFGTKFLLDGAVDIANVVGGNMRGLGETALQTQGGVSADAMSVLGATVQGGYTAIGQVGGAQGDALSAAVGGLVQNNGAAIGGLTQQPGIILGGATGLVTATQDGTTAAVTAGQAGTDAALDTVLGNLPATPGAAF